MVLAAIIFLINGVALLIRPADCMDALGIAISPELQWLCHMTALVLVALGIHQVTTSRHAADPAFKRAAIMSLLIEFGFAGIAYSGPGEATTLRWLIVVISSLLGLLYAITLPIKSIGIQEES